MKPLVTSDYLLKSSSNILCIIVQKSELREELEITPGAT